MQVPKVKISNDEQYSSDEDYSEEINRKDSFMETHRVYEKKLMQPYVVVPS
jgi:hypothetical protein